MRRVNLRPLDGSPVVDAPVAVAELLPDAKYIAAVTCGEGTSQAQRGKFLAELRAAFPDAAVVVLPHGYALELFEDAPPDPPAKRPRLGDG